MGSITSSLSQPQDDCSQAREQPGLRGLLSFGRGRAMRAIVLALSCTSGLHCAGERILDPAYPVNDQTSLAAIVSRLDHRRADIRRNQIVSAARVYVAVKSPNAHSEIIAYNLETDKVLWRRSDPLLSRIIVSKDRVFYYSKRTIGPVVVARSAATGALLWKRPAVGGFSALGGLAADDSVLVYATRAGGKHRLIGLDNKSGRLKWNMSGPSRIGAPILWAGYVFLPIQSHSIAIIGANNGREESRVHFPGERVDWVRAGDDGIFWGNRTRVSRLDRDVRELADGRVSLPKSPRVVTLPSFARKTSGLGYQGGVNGRAYGASARARIVWRAASRSAVEGPGGLRFQGDLMIVQHYRYLFALTEGADTMKGKRSSASPPAKLAPAGRLRWAYRSRDADFVAVKHVGASLLTLNRKGVIASFNLRDGTRTVVTRLALQAIRGATFDIAANRVAELGVSSRSGAVYPARERLDKAGSAPKTIKIEEVLTQIVDDRDSRFGAVKHFALEALLQTPGREATRALLRLLAPEAEPGSPTYRIQERVEAGLMDRADPEALEDYLELLNVHYNYAEGTHAVPFLGVLARILGRVGAQEAIDPLLAHLADHETSFTDTIDIVAALRSIGDPRIVDVLREYLLTYRCDPAFSDLGRSPLKIIAETIVDLGGKDDHALLRFVARHPQTLPALRKLLEKFSDVLGP